ncbi:hypothetical protein CTI12_AA055180 [Artemisia annua]|uniref:Uncharacterized protein n=1 Tax=Artemisia annua TaxID=35608 RepID=A0A2U1QA83_ARTAN|nr:hypothetical protein CTI12_AA055180 [Artemisia annua]
MKRFLDTMQWSWWYVFKGENPCAVTLQASASFFLSGSLHGEHCKMCTSSTVVGYFILSVDRKQRVHYIYVFLLDLKTSGVPKTFQNRSPSSAPTDATCVPIWTLIHKGKTDYLNRFLIHKSQMQQLKEELKKNQNNANFWKSTMIVFCGLVTSFYKVDNEHGLD